MDTFFKGNQHHSALTRNLDGSADVKSPGQNVAVNIRRSTRDETLEPVRRTSLREDGKPHRSAADLIDHLHRTEGKRGKNHGAFAKLRTGLREYVRENGGAEHLAKAVPTDDGLDQAALIRELKAVPKAPAKGALAKSLQPGLDKAAKNLGMKAPNLLKSLEAGYNSDSTTLAGGSALRRQSLSKRVASITVGGDPVPAKPKLLTKSQVEAACMKGLNSGAITGAEAAYVSTALSMDRRIPDELMKKIADTHRGAQP
ncbi:hypothetical protein P3T18_004451 [Paraburkholderia sp. GAS199]|uniref:hypothetical protein n=1 Tax=Paraburkholderia sp. GAS199 TaxID=3035126 RepID=UPI003D1A1225